MHKSHVAISSMLVNQLLYGTVRLSCFGFYGLSFVSNDGPRKPLEFQKLPSGDLQIVYLTRHMAHQDVW